jgi:hypothetical protein
MPIEGQRYTREQIAAAHGGSPIEFLPSVSGRVVCACLRTDPAYNPEAPRVILPGRGRRREQAAAVLRRQRDAIPIHIKQVPNAWKFVGFYEVENSTQARAEIDRYEKQTRRGVTSVIYMRKVRG